MSVRRLAAEQPEGFAFTPENLQWAKDQIDKYPQGRKASALLTISWRVSSRRFLQSGPPRHVARRA